MRSRGVSYLFVGRKTFPIKKDINKMAITKAIKEQLQNSSNNVPERVSSRGSNALRLKLVNGQKVMLINNKGVVTEYGKYWYDEVKKETRPREGFDPSTELIRRNRTDYIKKRNGQEHAVRTRRADLGEYSYTKLGREYFKEHLDDQLCPYP
jgi:hypothetical protein